MRFFFALLAGAATMTGVLALVSSPATKKETSETALAPVALRDDVGIVSTLSELDALNEQHGRDVRVDEVDGTLVLVRGATATHIGTLDGEALTMLQTAAGQDEANGGDVDSSVGERAGTLCSRKGKCVKERCMTLMTCGKGCRVCYMVHCH